MKFIGSPGIRTTFPAPIHSWTPQIVFDTELSEPRARSQKIWDAHVKNISIPCLLQQCYVYNPGYVHGIYDDDLCLRWWTLYGMNRVVMAHIKRKF